MQPGYMELSHEPGDGRYTYIKISRYNGWDPVKPGRCAARLRNINHSNGARLNSLRSNSSRPFPVLAGCFGALSQGDLVLRDPCIEAFSTYLLPPMLLDALIHIIFSQNCRLPSLREACTITNRNRIGYIVLPGGPNVPEE